ncbi:MAG: lysophospholipid acyltransferase family protein [Planctomycetes bacterium]|nr:lysophospholipid acyltransferase family protein [Planctomycetota bacterium]
MAYFAVRTVVCIVQAARLETCALWSSWLAWIAYDVVRLRRSVIDENLRLAFPEYGDRRRQEIARRMWMHLFLMACEVCHAPRKIHDTNWRDHVTLHRARDLVNVLLRRRPTVLVSGHFGNFEMAGFVAGLLGVPTYAIARPLDNPLVHDYLTRFRSSTGQHLLNKDGSASKIQDILEQGGALALLADQHAGPKGCWVEFFGRPASCHKALALFTLTNDAPMLVCFARRSGGPLQFEVGLAELFDAREGSEAELGVAPLTQWYSRVLEREVRRAPEQYWWVHRRWRDPPPARRKQKRENPPAAA